MRFSRKPGSDYPYHVGFDQGNDQILMLTQGKITSVDVSDYLKSTGYGVVGYADISKYVSACDFEKNVSSQKEKLESNFDNWNPSGTMCVDVMNAGFGNSFLNLKSDITKTIGGSDSPYYFRRNTTYVKYYKSKGYFK